MRVSPVGYAYDELSAVLSQAEAFTAVTHNHPEGAKVPFQEDQMKLAVLILLIMLSACATDRRPENTEEQSSGPTVYGQLSVTVDHISVE
jgi:ADP-ribosylglycohydrolase